jgi:hypothetical protein
MCTRLRAAGRHAATARLAGYLPGRASVHAVRRSRFTG